MATPMKLSLKKDDTVVIISGKDKGKKGKILNTLPKKGKIVVEGVNMVTKHQKPRGANQAGAKEHQEAPIFASKAMLFCNKCQKATRIAYQVNDDKTKVRICKKCGEVFDK